MKNDECTMYSKTLFKKSESTSKSFYHILFLEICQLFGLLPKSLVSKNSFCIGHHSKEFPEEGQSSVKDMEVNAAIYFYRNFDGQFL